MEKDLEKQEKEEAKRTGTPKTKAVSCGDRMGGRPKRETRLRRLNGRVRQRLKR